VLGAAVASLAVGSEPPLPDGDAVARGLIENTRRREKALDAHTYDLVEIREDLHGDGRVKSRKTRKLLVTHVEGRPVRRLVEEDGEPLPPARQAEVDREAAEKATAIRRGDVLVEDPVPRLSRILERYAFRSVAREDGLLVLEFAPRPGKRDLENDNVLRRVHGRLWVDEARGELVRARMHNQGAIKWALGLGARVSTLSMSMEFAEVGDVYLPRRIETEVAGRVLLFKGFRKRQVQEYGNYQRFSVSLDEAVAVPSPTP
jgi:hypothetical protein